MKKTPPKVNEFAIEYRGDGWDQKRVNAAHVKRLRRCVKRLRDQCDQGVVTQKQMKELVKMEKWV